MNLKISTCGLAAALALGATVSRADISFTPTVVSDYDFRGISLSARGPAVQGELDVSASNGLKGYVWASNTDIGVPGLGTEIDYLVGWSGGEKLVWDVGVVYYSYPSHNDLAYPEGYVGVSGNVTEKFNLGGKIWYSNDYGASDEAGEYYELNGSVALPWWDLSLGLHVGHSAGKYWDIASDGGYTDYSIGLSKNIQKLNLSLKVIDGSDLKDTGEAVLSTDRKVVFGIATTLPWKD